MARLLSTSQRDTDEVTSLIETLTGENRLMKKQIYEMKDAGESCTVIIIIITIIRTEDERHNEEIRSNV